MRHLTSLALVCLFGIVAADEPELPADVAVLLIGNSHSSRGELPKKLRLLLEAGLPGNTITVVRAPRWDFLAGRLDDGVTQKTLESDRWTHVVLQAQKYSTSGRYSYPTDAAEEWIRRVRAAGAEPILFPEWGQLGNENESLSVQHLHESIAEREPACVAPVGIAWEVARDNRPGLRLYSADGNHANNTGAFLAALVLYEVIAEEPAAGLPAVAKTGVKPELQAYLGSVVSAVLEQKPCPLGAARAKTASLCDPSEPTSVRPCD